MNTAREKAVAYVRQLDDIRVIEYWNRYSGDKKTLIDPALQDAYLAGWNAAIEAAAEWNRTHVFGWYENVMQTHDTGKRAAEELLKLKDSDHE